MNRGGPQHDNRHGTWCLVLLCGLLMHQVTAGSSYGAGGLVRPLSGTEAAEQGHMGDELGLEPLACMASDGKMAAKEGRSHRVLGRSIRAVPEHPALEGPRRPPRC